MITVFSRLQQTILGFSQNCWNRNDSRCVCLFALGKLFLARETQCLVNSLVIYTALYPSTDSCDHGVDGDGGDLGVGGGGGGGAVRWRELRLEPVQI